MKYVFDIEVFKNFFSVIFYNGEEIHEYSIYSERNQLPELLQFLDKTLIGYNNYFYDNIILNYLIKYQNALLKKESSGINKALYDLSVKTINLESQDRATQKVIRQLKYVNYFKSIDLMKVGGIMKSLKLTAVSLKHHRIQDLPYPFDKELTLDEIIKVLEYNFNDVDITWKLYQKLIKQIELREYLSESYNIPMIITESDSGICNKIIDQMYSNITGLEVYDFKELRTKHDSINLTSVIFDSIVFQTQELQDFLEYFKSIEYYSFKEAKTKFPILELGGLKIQCGFGGIHSEDSPAIFDNSESKLIDCDIGSMYPATIINHKLIGKHLDERLIQEYTNIRDERIRVKHTDKIKSDGLKIVLNSFFGKYGFDGSWLKDDEAMLKVTVNGQLYLLMLVEALVDYGFEVISLNTDGIITKVPEELELVYNSICIMWQDRTNYELEFTEYDYYVRRDINNYISRTTEGKIKQKGIFETDKAVNKGFDKPIVAIALNRYFLESIPVETTIRNHRDIYDMCSAQKIGKSYERVEFHLDDSKVEVQRSLRYYASNSGGELFKVKINENLTESYQTLLSSSKITLFNDYYDSEDYDINYQYYIDECNKIICLIEGRIFIDKDKLEEKIAKIQERLGKNQAKYDNFIAKQSKSKAVETTKLMIDKLTIELEELNKLRI